MLLSQKYFLYGHSERGAAEEKLPPQTCGAQVNSGKRLYPRDGGEGTVFSDVSYPRGRVKATKRRAALHICDPKSAEKSMPRRVARIPYAIYNISIYAAGGPRTRASRHARRTAPAIFDNTRL